MGCMAEGYAKVELRPCVTEIDIERVLLTRHRGGRTNPPNDDDDLNDTNDNDQSSHCDKAHGSPIVKLNDWYDDDDSSEEKYEPRYLWKRRMLSEGLAEFLKAIKVASNSADASV